MMWRGTAQSAVSLHPPSNFRSWAYGVSHDQIVGKGLSNRRHALLWRIGGGYVDLNPAGFADSEALGTNGSLQVGYAQNDGPDTHRAIVWHGTAATAVNLQSFLPSQYSQSEAYGIDEFGNIAGAAIEDGLYRACVWHPVPEPFGWLFFAAGSLLVVARSLRRTA